MPSAELSFVFGPMELLGCGNRSILEQEDGIHHLFSVVQNDTAVASSSSSSFTALLELPPNQAVQLLHSPLGPAAPALDLYSCGRGGGGLVFPPPDGCLIERAARFSVLGGRNNSPETTGSVPSSDSCANLGMPPVKHEPLETEFPDNNINSTNNNQSGPLVSDPTVENGAQPDQRQPKRKEREKKVNNHGSKKKSKSGGGKESSEEGEKLPYVHVRARRGQATDSHSLAERARREKINARMKLLQELVPGCNKISGTALVLDEIINHVQSLQRQVEFLSMRLAAVNPRIDFNLDSLLAADNGSLAESNFSSMTMPLIWQEAQNNGNRQHYQQQWPLDPHCQPVWVQEEDSPNFITPENSLLSYDSLGNSVSLHTNQVKMEL